jgi:hypothetical protein
MSVHATPSAFIMIDSGNVRRIDWTFDYQQIALNNYIENRYTTAVEYGTDDEECFSISQFDYKTAGLTGEYDDIYNYIKSDGTVLLISCNYSKLSALCEYFNRLTESSQDTMDSSLE